MPSTAARAIPYPSPSDPATEGAEAIRLLAERVDELLPRTGSTGLLTVGATTTDYTKAVVFTRPFPAGVTPKVTATADTSTATVGVAVNNVTNTGFTLVYRRHAGATNIGDCHWIAVYP